MHTSTHCTLRPLAPKGNGTQQSDLCQSTASCALHHKSSCKCECVCSLFEMNHSVLSNPLPVQRPMNNGSWASRHHCKHTTPSQHRSITPIVNHSCNVMTEAFTYCRRTWARKSTNRTAPHLCRKPLRAQRPAHANEAHDTAQAKGERACHLLDVCHIKISHEGRAFPLTSTKNLC